MTARPTSNLANWASTGAILEPSVGEKNAGHAPGDRPPAQWINYIYSNLAQWGQFLNACFGDVVALHGGAAFTGDSGQFMRALALSKEVAAVLSSKDVATPATAVISAFAASEQRIVACGDAGKIYTNDALGQGTWTTRTPPGGYADTYYAALLYNQASFVIGGASSALHTSPDGTTWTARTSTFTGGDAVLAMASRGSALAIVGENGSNACSTNGTTFTANGDLVGVGFDIVDITVAPSTGVFVCCGYGGSGNRANYIHRSANGGAGWVAVNLTSVLSANERVRLVDYHASLGFVGLVEDIGTADVTALIVSADGLTWTKKTGIASYGVASGALYMTATVGGLLFTSPDPLQPSLHTFDGDNFVLTPVVRTGIGPGLPQSFSVLKFNNAGAYIALMAASSGDKISVSPPWVY